MRTPRTPFLATRPAAPRDYLSAGAILLLLLAVAGAIAPFAGLLPRLQEQALGTVYVGSMVLQLVITAILYGQWRAARHVSTGMLAVAFAYSTALLFIFMLEYPKGVTPNGLIPLAPGTLGYVWAAWQFGTFTFFGLFAATARRLRPFDTGVAVAASGAIAAAVAFTLLIILKSGSLPPIAVDTKFTPFAEHVVQPFFLALGVAALVAIVAATRVRRWIDVYAALFVIGMIVSTYLIQIGGDRYSFGRLGARIEMFVVSLTFCFALIRQINHMYWQLTAENRRLAHAALVDPLTGLANRRAFDVHLESLEPNSVLLVIDIDRFKAYNDLEGHGSGDDCIKRVGRTLAANVLRSEDLIARWGGDEFAVVLHNIDLDDAIHVAERIRRAVAELAVLTHGGVESALTVSIGVAAFLPGEATSELVRRADEALYRAKADGRNRVAFDEATILESA
jgi:diguanylate cyclase (GGDEF)-like protein